MNPDIPTLISAAEVARAANRPAMAISDAIKRGQITSDFKTLRRINLFKAERLQELVAILNRHHSFTPRA